MRTKSLRVRLTTLVATLILLTVAILGIFLGLAYSHDQQKRLGLVLTKELEIVSYATSAGLEFDDIKTVEEALDLLKSVKEFDDVTILDPGNRVVAHKVFLRTGESAKADAFVVEAPVFNDGRVRIGTIRAVATARYFKEDVQRALWVALLFTCCVILFALFFVAVFLKKFFKPLADLKDAIDRVAGHGFMGRVDVISDDEVGELATSFNAMSESLRETTVSRDDLAKEIGERKLAEQRLKEAYEDLKKAQAQLVQSEKMASLGQLSAGVAHEINNPLLFIMGNLSILRTYLQSYHEAIDAGRKFVVLARRDAAETEKRQIDELSEVINGEKLEDIMKDTTPLLDQTLSGLERVKKIVLDLKTFARAGTDVKDKKDINQIVANAISICFNELKYKVDLTREYGDIPQIMCDGQRLGQVFVNLLLNAGQAIEERGTIHVETFFKDGMVCVKIKDSGKGIPKESQHKIFDPFFTTKSKGTGLGLSVSYDIVKRHGGSILVESEQGQGTAMTVMLPLKENVVSEDKTIK